MRSKSLLVLMVVLGMFNVDLPQTKADTVYLDSQLSFNRTHALSL